MVLSIERLGRNMNWKIICVGAEREKVITVLTILGIASLFLWIIFHP